jgi:predicted small integral membrane protein
LRLDPRFRWALYAAFGALFLTGAAWLVADQMKEGVHGDAWQETASYLLMIHGGAAMLMLMLYGALVPLHIARSWRARRNRVTGTAMATFNAVLIVTSFGLYYAGSEVFRPWMSGVHIAVGLALPVLIALHVVLGRRSAEPPRPPL